MKSPSETALLATTVGLVEFVHGALLIVLLPTLVAQRLGWAMGTTGAAVSAYFFTEVAAKLVSGWLVDRVGARRMLLWGFWSYAAGFAALASSRTTWQVFLALSAMGAGASPLWPAALTRLTRSAGPQVGEALGNVFSTWFLGAGLGIGVATLVSRTNHPISLSVFILPLLGAALLGLLVPGDPANPTPVGGRPPVGQLLRLVGASLVKLATSIIPQIIAAGVLIPVVVPYLETVRGLDERQLLVLMVLGIGTGLLLLTPAGRIGDRVGRRRTYALGLGVVAVLLLAVPFCHSLWLLALDFIGLGVGYAFVLPAWNSILLRLLPVDIRGSGLGVLMTVEGMGGVIGPLVGGLLWQWSHPSAPFYLSGGLLLLASGASVRWRSDVVDC
ncbi:MAG TPA: MFS transporter [bacterium]|nr:MFS transporter [bacterium]